MAQSKKTNKTDTVGIELVSLSAAAFMITGPATKFTNLGAVKIVLGAKRLVYAAADGQSLINRIESKNGILTLEHAEKSDLATRRLNW